MKSMKLKFVGVGPMSATPEQWQTNAVVTYEENGAKRHLLIDCGGDNRHALAEAGVKLEDIDGAYVSHLHPDHADGLGPLGIMTYFHPKLDRPKLYCDLKLMHQLWDNVMKGGCDTIEGKVVTLTDYYNCKPVVPNGTFEWHGVTFRPIQTIHVVGGYKFMHSFGLMIDIPYPNDTHGSLGFHGKRIFYTSDTQFCPHQIQCFYDKADLIIHDCETTVGFKSGVHAHFDDLKTLSDETKKKMWLVHYQPIAGKGHLQLMAHAIENGFAGFVLKGDEFMFDKLLETE